MNPQALLVPQDAQSQRLDRWLSVCFREKSRGEIQRWIKNGLVTVNDQPAKASMKVIPGQRVVVKIPPPPADSTLIPEPLPLNILFEDANLAVIDKAAGMVVHPSPGHERGTLVNAILHHCPDIEGVGGERRPGIVHRLDKETSGLIVVAKNDSTHQFLQAQFQTRTVYKEYLALLEGVVDPPTGRINAPIGRHPVHRQRQAILPPDPLTGISPGREAITEYETVGVHTSPVRDSTGLAHFSLVRVILHTGRTHQIRVHFAWRKHPVVGDTLYGYRRQRLQLKRHFLHAYRMRLRLPNQDDEQEFVAPLPPELDHILASMNQ
ncbi:MAG: RluA family pseudouridine synthase [Chloroflexota bacterium]